MLVPSEMSRIVSTDIIPFFGSPLVIRWIKVSLPWGTKRISSKQRSNEHSKHKGTNIANRNIKLLVLSRRKSTLLNAVQKVLGWVASIIDLEDDIPPGLGHGDSSPKTSSVRHHLTTCSKTFPNQSHPHDAMRVTITSQKETVRLAIHKRRRGPHHTKLSFLSKRRS